MAIQRFEQLEAWQYAHQLVLATYKASRTLPGDERFGLVQQLRRAAVSVPANVAEGFTRRSSKEKLHFYNISQASLQELRYYVILCRDLEYWGEKESEALADASHRVGRLLAGLMRSICA